jgi:predicted Zn-dependent protease
MRWALTEASLAQLAIKDGVAARKYLRRLLWTTEVDAKQFAKWRRMVIRSYLVDDNVADAHTALRRYKQDYRVNDDVWRLLHAKVLLRAGRYKGALDVLQDIQSVEGKLLRLLAGLRSGIYQASVVKNRGSQLVKLAERKPALQRNVWALIAESAAKAGDAVHRVIALEQGLSLSNDSTQSDHLFALKADDAWQ